MFYKNPAGEVFHTYSSYGRGLDILIGAYNFLDIAPKGRDEEGLRFSMAWVRHHDKYEGAAVDPNAAISGTESGRPGLLGIVLRLIDGGARSKQLPDERPLFPGYRCCC